MARRRPWRLVSGQTAKQPIRAPACWMPTAMELMRVASASVKLKSVWKEGKVRTPPFVFFFCRVSEVSSVYGLGISKWAQLQSPS